MSLRLIIKMQRDMLKGRVRNLLKEQKDMGQVGESAVLCCASAVQIFVRELANKMIEQSTEAHRLTPIELKKSILASGELNFLHEKVTAIDESSAKYHKPVRGGKKRSQTDAAKKLSLKKARKTTTTRDAKTRTRKAKAKAAISTAKKSVEPRTQSSGRGASTAKDRTALASSIPKAHSLVVEEDEDYDESDSDT